MYCRLCRLRRQVGRTTLSCWVSESVTINFTTVYIKPQN